jgi:hypothetical protein
MKRSILFFVLCGLTVVTVPLFTSDIHAQDEDVRGAFLTTRPKGTAKSPSSRPGKAIRRRPRPTPEAKPSSGKSKTPESKPSPTVRQQKIGLGLTLFMRDSNGVSVRVDPEREFRRNERVRLLLETNVDGYLYVFNTTDGGEPVMIYPDPELDEGGNYIQSHVPVEVPSSVAAEERLRWFRFDENPGVERLYFVFTREPLTGIPLEDELISFCRENSSNCPIKPMADLWARLQKESNIPIESNKKTQIAGTQTDSEHQATTRGIGLNRGDPEPSLVMMSASSSSSTLVTTLDLIHK